VLTPGDVLGDCEILTLLGRGGMGEVYLARDRRLRRKVALKVLPATFASDRDRLGRFEREARSASALNHPNICTIHALGELPDGRHFIVMEQVEGTTLRAAQHGPGDLRRVVDLGRQLAEGLAAAHDAGIVHRDVKPENVMVRADGLVKILDFGLAKILPDSAFGAGDSTRWIEGTITGGIVGTVQYMSPEQARGQTVDSRTDVWAVGVVVYELVTGHPPFGGRTTSDIVANVLNAEPPSLAQFAPDCPPELQRIVTKCLRKDRAQRYQSMRELALDLQALGDTLRGPATPALPPLLPVGTRRLSRASIAVVVAALVVAAAGVAWWVRRPATQTTSASTTTRQLALRRLTFDNGLQTDASLSPDGKLLAYASDRSGNFDIWVQPVNGGEAVQITHEPGPDVQPAWSPDGESLAFRSERNGGGIFVAPVLGGHARQLSAVGSHPSWLGKSEILFVVGNPDAGVASAAQLFTVGLDGEPPHEVLHDFLAGGGLFWAAAHPDGRISVFAEHRPLGRGFYTVSRDGRAVSTSHIPASFPMHQSFLAGTPIRFQWNRAGSALYVEATVDGIQNLWRIGVNPQSLEWLNLERLTTGPGRDVAASLSGDGRRLAYTTTSEQTRVYVQTLSGDGRAVTGSPAAITDTGAEAFGSLLSHDGRRLAYIVRRSGSERFELRVVRMDTGQNELLDEDVRGNVHMAWSSDDAAVLHELIKSVDGQPERIQVQLVRHVPGGAETVLFPWNTQTAFLPTDATDGGHELLGSVFHLTNAPAEIGLWPVVDGVIVKPGRLLFSDPAADLWEPGFVPKGRWISFVRQPRDIAQRLDLMVAPAEGAPPAAWTRVAAAHQWADKPRWAPDGKLLYFLSRGSSPYFNLWAVPFDPVRGVPAGEPFAITRYDSPALFVSPHVEKTGMDVVNGRVTLTMTSTVGSIWMLDDVEPGDSRAVASP
jgi:eukaryotic-like serine/threonine-protein kinase